MDWSKEFYLKDYSFTLGEIRDLIISVLILSFIFTYALFNSFSILNFLQSFLIVILAFVGHELAHKFVSQKFGFQANYSLWLGGVILSIIFWLFSSQGSGLIFAALGAVNINLGKPSKLKYKTSITINDIGKISVAGPLANIFLAILSYMFLWLNPGFFKLSAEINLILAFFNSLPFPPLDGIKIFVWSYIVDLIMIITPLILLFLPGVIGLFLTLLLTVIIIVSLFLFIKMHVG